MVSATRAPAAFVVAGAKSVTVGVRVLVLQNAAAPFMEPPTVRGFARLALELEAVLPSAWSQEKRGFKSSPLNGVISGLKITE